MCSHWQETDQHWAVRFKLNWAVLIHAQPFSWLRGHLLCERTSWKTVTSLLSALCRSRTVVCSWDIVGPVEAKTTWLVFSRWLLYRVWKNTFSKQKIWSEGSQHRRCPLQNDRLHDTLGKKWQWSFHAVVNIVCCYFETSKERTD